MNFAGPKLIAIGSGKGGTGKTFLTLALAQALADQGERVLVCDADLGLANAAVHLGLAEAGDLPALLAGKIALAGASVPVATPGHAHFDLLGAPAGSGALADAGEDTTASLAMLLRRAHAYDLVAIDLGAGVGAPVMALAAMADETIVAMTPDPAALTDAYAFVKLMQKRTGGRAPSIVVNRANGAGEAKRTAEALIRAAKNFLRVGLSYRGFVPADAHVGEALCRQKALAVLYPQSPAQLAVVILAQGLRSRETLAKAARPLR
jgi:flagellar biosynthesis protein FlhG